MSEPVHARGAHSADFGQLVGSLIFTLISVGMLLGAFLLSRVDLSVMSPTPTPAEGAVRPTATFFLPTLPSQTATFIPSLTPSPTVLDETSSPTSTPTPTPPDRLIPSCSPPVGWVVYTVRPGDTLTDLALRSGSTVFALMQGNCMTTQAIFSGRQIYLPPAFYVTATPPPYPCGPPLGWTSDYRVQPGDTLYSLSRRFGVGIQAIRRANCLDSYQINVGQALYLPPPLYTPTPTLTPTSTPTPTLTPVPTDSPTPTPTWTAAPELSPTLTSTPSPTTAVTPTVTATPTTMTVTPVSTVTPTLTSTPDTPTVTPTPTPTPTSTSTVTLTPTESSTLEDTPTFTPTVTPTD